MTTIFILLCVLTLFITLECSEKRLLFNDPQTIQSMLQNYEIQLNKYGNTLQQLENKVTTLQNEKAALNLELTNATNSIKELHGLVGKLETEKTRLQSRIDVMESSYKEGSSTYIRWGRTSCVNDSQTDLVYKGNAGGSSHVHPGSAVDYLCLPHDPEVSIPENDLLSTPKLDAGLLYGAEYEMNYRNVRYNDGVPCAVCRVQASVLMIPGKSTCPQDWKILYHGLLSSNYYGHQGASRFICLDKDPEYVPGTRIHNDNGKLFYPVRTRCGSLECPPYKDDTIITCVVCAK